jgi:hypothetical protein
LREKPLANVEFRYLYRDGGNYKKRGSVIFSNAEGLDIDLAVEKLQQAFLTDGLFIARQARVPEVFLYSRGKFTDDDHCYHEFDELGSTSEAANDKHLRSIREFVDEVTAEAGRGWLTLDPNDAEYSLLGFLASRIP